MNTGPIVAVALVVTQASCFHPATEEYVAAYKDFETCQQRTENLKKKHPLDDGLRRRRCVLVGILQDANAP